MFFSNGANSTKQTVLPRLIFDYCSLLFVHFSSQVDQLWSCSNTVFALLRTYMSNLISSGIGMGMDGIPILTIYPRQPKNSGFQPTICRFFKTLNFIIFALKIKLNTCKNNRNFILIYFKGKCQSKCKTPSLV